MVDRCFALYDDTLKKNGHWVYGIGLQGPEATMSLHHKNGKVAVTDGPYAETKELLGGCLIIEAKDLNHAVRVNLEPPRRGHGRLENSPCAESKSR